MGLDNIPNKYPCMTAGTALMLPRFDRDTGEPLLDTDGNVLKQIDCEATQEAGGCPWKNDLGGKPGAVLGMFGTDCWYRGKYGERLLRILEVDERESFYGDDPDGNYKDPESCLRTAAAMERGIARSGPELDAETRSDVEYAIAWLRWVAEKADGTATWY